MLYPSLSLVGRGFAIVTRAEAGTTAVSLSLLGSRFSTRVVLGIKVATRSRFRLQHGPPQIVVPGLGPGIYKTTTGDEGVDGRDMPGQDDKRLYLAIDMQPASSSPDSPALARQ